MSYIIISSVILLIAFIAIIISYRIFKKRENELNKCIDDMETDKKNMENYNRMLLDAIFKQNNDLRNNFIKLNELLSLKKLDNKKSNILNQIFRNVIEELNNIDVIASDKTDLKIEENDIKEELKILVEEIKECVSNKEIKIDISVDKEISTKLVYDNLKLISILRLIILKSIENGITDNIKINAELYKITNSKFKMKISIENIKFTSNDYIDQSIIEHFICMEKIDLSKINFPMDADYLTIRQNILNLSGSRVSYNHKFGKEPYGTTFAIDMLVKKARPKSKKIKALIVDDNKQTAKMNQDVLKELKIDSHFVLSGKECLEELENNYDEYDIVITDNQMPEMSGTDLIRKLKDRPDFELPVVIVTGDSNQNNIFINHYGFDGYIQKPLNKEKAEIEIKRLIKYYN